MLNKFLAFRQQQVQRLEADPALSIGDVTTVNLTMIQGGVQMNVVPPLMNVSFDVRLAIDVSHEKFEQMVRSVDGMHSGWVTFCEDEFQIRYGHALWHNELSTISHGVVVVGIQWGVFGVDYHLFGGELLQLIRKTPLERSHTDPRLVHRGRKWTRLHYAASGALDPTDCYRSYKSLFRSVSPNPRRSAVSTHNEFH